MEDEDDDEDNKDENEQRGYQTSKATTTTTTSTATTYRARDVSCLATIGQQQEITIEPPVVRQTSRPRDALDAALPLGGSRGGRDAHETAVRVSMRLQKATPPTYPVPTRRL